MMVNSIITAIWLHFLADFILQSTNIAMNKYKNNLILGIHALIYTAVMGLFGWQIALINGITHFGIDYVTSKLTHNCWSKKEYRWFFIIIGCDQALHMSILVQTLKWFI